MRSTHRLDVKFESVTQVNFKATATGILQQLRTVWEPSSRAAVSPYPLSRVAALTSSEGRNLLSFSTATSFLGPALMMERVREPGPGPTSHTQQSRRSPATRTIRSGEDGEIERGRMTCDGIDGGYSPSYRSHSSLEGSSG